MSNFDIEARENTGDEVNPQYSSRYQGEARYVEERVFPLTETDYAGTYLLEKAYPEGYTFDIHGRAYSVMENGEWSTRVEHDGGKTYPETMALSIYETAKNERDYDYLIMGTDEYNFFVREVGSIKTGRVYISDEPQANRYRFYKFMPNNEVLYTAQRTGQLDIDAAKAVLNYQGNSSPRRGRWNRNGDTTLQMVCCSGFIPRAKPQTVFLQLGGFQLAVQTMSGRYRRVNYTLTDMYNKGYRSIPVPTPQAPQEAPTVEFDS